MQYSKENLKTDLEWFKGLGVEEEEAKGFIFYVLRRKPSKDLFN